MAAQDVEAAFAVDDEVEEDVVEDELEVDEELSLDEEDDEPVVLSLFLAVDASLADFSALTAPERESLR
ncbi:hypothetical protein [Actinoplanes sp. NPDC051851]|uniref:hypothetical protein n=1 Tax=Actinoplanes sp. NPDC051851 TaxID=3154753 RepID=UPI0034163A91